MSFSVKFVAHKKTKHHEFGFLPAPKALAGPEDLHTGCWTRAKKFSELLVFTAASLLLESQPTSMLSGNSKSSLGQPPSSKASPESGFSQT